MDMRAALIKVNLESYDVFLSVPFGAPVIDIFCPLFDFRTSLEMAVVCALVQILLDKTKLMPGRVMVLLVCTGSILGAIGIYQPLIDFAGAGAAVPLLGFGNTLWKGLKEAIDTDGVIGLFTGGFTACAAGVSAALIFSYLASWFFKPKMKE